MLQICTYSTTQAYVLFQCLINDLKNILQFTGNKSFINICLVLNIYNNYHITLVNHVHAVHTDVQMPPDIICRLMVEKRSVLELCYKVMFVLFIDLLLLRHWFYKLEKIIIILRST